MADVSDESLLQGISIDPRERLRILNEERFEAFLLSDEEKLVIRTPAIWMLSFWPFNRVFGDEVVYTKDKTSVGKEGHQVVVIKKDNEPDFFIWLSGSQEFSEGVPYGFVKPKTFTGKFLHALAGGYQKKFLGRIYENGTISIKHNEKDALRTIVRHRVEFTQPLECLVNSDDSMNFLANRNRVLEVLRKYIFTLERYKATLESKVKHVKLLENYNKNALEEIKNNIQRDIDEMTRIVRSIRNPESLEDFLCATGPRSVMTYVKTHAVRAVRQMQKHNQDISYNVNPEAWRRGTLSFLRGDLHTVGEDAINVYEEEKAYHNSPLVPELQGHHAQSKGGKLLCMSFKSLGNNSDEIKKAFMGISQIEGDDKVEIDKKGNAWLVSKSSNIEGKDEQKEIRQKLKITNFTKFADAGPTSNRSGWKRFSQWCSNFVVGLIKGILGIVYGLGVGFLGVESASISKALRFKAVDEARWDTKYNELAGKMRVSTELGGFKIGRALGWIARQLSVEVLIGLAVIFKKVIIITFFKEIAADYSIGRAGLRSEEEILKHAEAKVNAIKEETDRVLNEAYKKDYKKDLFISDSTTHTKRKFQFARPPFELMHKNTVGKAAVGVASSLLLTLARAVPAKHPVMGFILFSFTFLGAHAYSLPDPASQSSVWDKYVAFTKSWASSMVQGEYAGATTGFTQGQFVSAIMEAIIHGRKSWIADFLKQIESTPDQVLLMISGAFFGGTLLTHIEDIPYLGSIPFVGPFLKWIGEKMLGEMGTGPLQNLTLLTFTAKIALIVHEFTEVHEQHQSHTSDEEFIKTLAEKFGSLYRKQRGIAPDASLDEGDQASIDGFAHKAVEEAHQQKQVRLQAESKSAVSIRHRSRLANPLKSDAFFLLRLQKMSSDLPLLDRRSKRELEEAAYRRFSDRPEIVNAVREMLHPPKSQSAVVTTLSDVADVISKLIRAIISPITGYWRVWPLFLRATKNLIVENGLSPIADAVHIGLSVVRVALHWAGDLIFNALLARIGLHQSISKLTYGISAWFDTSYEKWRQVSSIPIDVARKSTGYAPSTHVIKEALKADPSNAVIKYAVKRVDRVDTDVANSKVSRNSQSSTFSRRKRVRKPQAISKEQATMNLQSAACSYR